MSALGMRPQIPLSTHCGPLVLWSKLPLVKQKTTTIPLLTFSVLAGGLAFLWLDNGFHTETLPRPFESRGWKAADLWADTRCGMVLDLRHRIGLVGKTRAEVIALLGNPDDEDSDQSLDHWHLCPSFMDVWILEVRWEGDVATSAIVRDT